MDDKYDVPVGERESVPAWARGMAPPGAPGGMSGPKITDPQRGYLLSLIAKKQVKPDQEGKLDLIMKCLRISEDPEEYGMSKAKASELITWFLRQDDKPRNEQEAHERAGRLEDLKWQQPLVDLPPGRYAIENNEGELRFYERWQGKGDKKDRFALYVMFGPYEAKLPRNAQVAIAKKILDAGVRECAIRFGQEIKACSNCGRRLTNKISRELAIGPVCGGRMFGEDFRFEVKVAREAIIARGEDPDEEVHD
jgi:hypothetical protein